MGASKDRKARGCIFDMEPTRMAGYLQAPPTTSLREAGAGVGYCGTVRKTLEPEPGFSAFAGYEIGQSGRDLLLH